MKFFYKISHSQYPIDNRIAYNHMITDVERTIRNDQKFGSNLMDATGVFACNCMFAVPF